MKRQHHNLPRHGGAENVPSIYDPPPQYPRMDRPTNQHQYITTSKWWFKSKPFYFFYTFSCCKFTALCICQKYENWLKVDKVIAIIKRRPFLDHGTADEPTLLHAYNTASTTTNSATFYADSAAKQLNINNPTYNDTLHKQCIVDAFNK